MTTPSPTPCCSARGLGELIAAGIPLLLLPLLGVWLAGHPLARYAEFPPHSRYVVHAPFAWTAWLLQGTFVLAVVAALAWALWRQRRVPAARRVPGVFPAWGWGALALGLAAWAAAWGRWPWLGGLAEYTFTPLWLAYILVVNALCQRRTGTCPLTRQPRAFLGLFLLSAAFWWFFEYLNRFVQNWFYHGASPYSAWGYALHASICFATVLPAVIATRELLLSLGPIDPGLGQGPALRPSRPRLLAGLVLTGAAAGLALVGVLPDLLFPLLWLAPLLILAAARALRGADQPFAPLARGDWRLLIAAALAALLCGFFWEMWNVWSLPKWTYEVPLVDRFHLFEMPLLGYAGYLPFGLECALVADIACPALRPPPAPTYLSRPDTTTGPHRNSEAER